MFKDASSEALKRSLAKCPVSELLAAFVRRVAQQLALAIQLETRGVNSFLATARVFDRHDLDIGRKAYRAFRKIITAMTSY